MQLFVAHLVSYIRIEIGVNQLRLVRGRVKLVDLNLCVRRRTAAVVVVDASSAYVQNSLRPWRIAFHWSTALDCSLRRRRFADDGSPFSRTKRKIDMPM